MGRMESSMMLVGVCLRAWPADPAACSHPLTCPSGRWIVPGTASPSPWWAHPWGTLGTARPVLLAARLCLFAWTRHLRKPVVQTSGGHPSRTDTTQAKPRADESCCAPRRRMCSGVEAEYGSFSCVPSCASSCQHPYDRRDIKCYDVVHQDAT